jgi:hypothetical protein
LGATFVYVYNSVDRCVYNMRIKVSISSGQY